MTKDDTVLTMYLREINKIPLLTREEENELALKAKNGDVAAKNKIVNANLRFVITVAKKYQNSTKSHNLSLPVVLIELLSKGLIPGIVLSNISVKLTFAFASIFT